MKLLEGKVSVITGAGRGIGKAIAQTFVNNGAKVVIGDIKEEWVKETADGINQINPGSVVALRLDISDQVSATAAIDTAVEQFGKINILVNNAGIHRSHSFLDYPVEDFDLVYSVNARGTFLCSQAAAKQMVKQGLGGSIICIASASGKKPDQGGTAYNSSKSAVIGLTRMMALPSELYPTRSDRYRDAARRV